VYVKFLLPAKAWCEAGIKCRSDLNSPLPPLFCTVSHSFPGRSPHLTLPPLIWPPMPPPLPSTGYYKRSFSSPFLAAIPMKSRNLHPFSRAVSPGIAPTCFWRVWKRPPSLHGNGSFLRPDFQGVPDDPGFPRSNVYCVSPRPGPPWCLVPFFTLVYPGLHGSQIFPSVGHLLLSVF